MYMGNSNRPDGQRRGLISKCFPVGFYCEFKELTTLAIPIMLTSLVTYMFGPISVIFCGHLGKTELAAVGLAISVFNVSGVAVITGLLTACDTLFSQTSGGEEKFKMGIQLQRAMFLISMCCLPCWAVHLCLEPLLLTANQNPAIAKFVAHYMLLLMPGLFFVAVYQVLTKYVQTQNKVLAPLLIGVFGNAMNALLHYCFLYHTDLGITGSAIAQSIAYFLEALGAFIYLIFSGILTHTWTGYRVEMWNDWNIWFKLALPGLAMLGLEWWIFESGSLIAGVLGEQELGAQTILFNLESLTFTLLPLGFGAASSIRVGQFLGARSELGPRSTTSTALVTVWCAAIVIVLGLIFLRWELPKIFTDNKNIIALAADVLPILAAFQFTDGTIGVTGGVMRGAGLQTIGAIICFVTLYIIALPMGTSLLFLTDLQLKGLWVGLTAGSILQASIYLYICIKIDWKKQVILAVERTAIKLENSEQERVPSSSNNALAYGTFTGEETGNQHQATSRVSVFPATTCTESIAEAEDPSELLLAQHQTTLEEEEAGLESHKKVFLKSYKTRLLNRLCLITLMCLSFVISLCFRLLLTLSDYFGAFCIYDNGSFVHVAMSNLNFDNHTQTPFDILPANCTILIP